MWVLFGTYHFKPKRIGYRKDYCAVCDAPTMAFRFQAWVWGHLFFIPLLPLGRWQSWKCGSCGKSPSAPMKPVATALLGWGTLVGTAGMLAMLTNLGNVEDGISFGASLLFLALATGGFGYFFWRHLRSERRTKKLAMVHPCSRSECALCGGRLSESEPPYCSSCEVHRWEVQ